MRNIKGYTDHIKESQDGPKSLDSLWVVYYLGMSDHFSPTNEVYLVGAWEDYKEAWKAYESLIEDTPQHELLTISSLEEAEEILDPWTGREGYEDLLAKVEDLDDLPEWAMQQIRRRKRSRGAFGRF